MKITYHGAPLTVALATAALLAAPSVQGQAQGTPQSRDVAREAVQHLRDFQQARTGQRGEVDRNELHMLEKAMSANAGSIEIARLAEERARDRDIRSFAREERQLHQDANRELAGLSRELDANRARSGEQDRWILSQLRRIDNDREFERAYAELVVARHEDAIDAMEFMANDDRASAAVRDYSQRQLGDMRQHLRTAQRLERDVRPLAGRDDD
jgi:putative membrane protein